jgi:hypothetical protein
MSPLSVLNNGHNRNRHLFYSLLEKNLGILENLNLNFLKFEINKSPKIGTKSKFYEEKSPTRFLKEFYFVFVRERSRNFGHLYVLKNIFGH